MLQCFWVPGERLLPTVENEEVSLAHALLDHCHIAALSRCKLESEVVQQVSQPVMEAEWLMSGARCCQQSSGVLVMSPDRGLASINIQMPPPTCPDTH